MKRYKKLIIVVQLKYKSYFFIIQMDVLISH